MNSPALRIRSTSVGDTSYVGCVVAGFLVPGDLVLLDGDLGAGKTALVKGLARGLGVEEPVTSPTFALLRSYRTARGIELVHGDLYRLDSDAEIADLALGLDEVLADGGIVALEWGGRAVFLLEQLEYLVVRIDLGFPDGYGSDDDSEHGGDDDSEHGGDDDREHGGDDDRTVSFSFTGRGWLDRRDQMSAALAVESQRLVEVPRSDQP